MARYEHVRVFQLSYNLTLKIYKISSNFKKEHKYILGEKLILISHKILDFIVEANSLEKKSDVLRRLNLELESLRIYIRIAMDLKLISFGFFEDINKNMLEIGQQIGAWQKWSLKNEQTNTARVSSSQAL